MTTKASKKEIIDSPLIDTGPLGDTSISTVEAVLYPTPEDCLDSTHACNSQMPMLIDPRQ